MKTKLILILCLLILMSISCSDPASSDPGEIKKEINQVLNNYVKDVNIRGLENAASYFADDERFYWVEDGVVQYPNRTALIKGIAGFAPAVSSVLMTVSGTRIDVIDPQHALLFVQYKEDIVLRSNYTVKLDGAMTIFLERKNGTWKFLSGHSSVKKPRNNT